MENGPLIGTLPIQIAISHGYVNLPEGKLQDWAIFFGQIWAGKLGDLGPGTGVALSCARCVLNLGMAEHMIW